MDFQHRAGGKTGSGGVASSSESNRDRRERLRQLALETIDINKDPYFMKNHLGSYECKLCLTLHNNEVRVTLCKLPLIHNIHIWFAGCCLRSSLHIVIFHFRAATSLTHKARSIRPICEWITIHLTSCIHLCLLLWLYPEVLDTMFSGPHQGSESSQRGKRSTSTACTWKG